MHNDISFEEFKKSVRKSVKGTTFKIRDSFGIYDAYKAIRKNKWYDIGRPLKEHEFYSIIRGINKLLAKELTLGKTVYFPYQMGKLELRKYETGVKFVNGKLKNTYNIDWNNTLYLWYKDDEAHKNKILLRYNENWAYHIKYSKISALYKNRCFYQFALNTHIRKELLKNINQGIVDTIY